MLTPSPHHPPSTNRYPSFGANRLSGNSFYWWACSKQVSRSWPPPWCPGAPLLPSLEPSRQSHPLYLWRGNGFVLPEKVRPKGGPTGLWIIIIIIIKALINGTVWTCFSELVTALGICNLRHIDLFKMLVIEKSFTNLRQSSELHRWKESEFKVGD